MDRHPPEDGFDSDRPDPLYGDESDGDEGALDFLYRDEDSGAYQPDDVDEDSDADGADESDGRADSAQLLFTVANPQHTVEVAAYLDGRIQRIRLAPGVTRMTEVELAQEVCVIADLARQDARSAQYSVVYDGLSKLGHDRASTRDFLSRNLDLPSPEDAAAARAQVFATRYVGDND
ncbi:YbaB/EbfC family DNA-binding protein [Mycobacterium sp. OTB74]|uniref:YbaB/EbfC family DNA-binding protein n=1 Tax=Mycobacterium sp. OTB74 TaxID=1853452 RepID=UPI00247374C2|nr:YbaB/EbfC family DNA-binding protein [Mycobacterium sp. OTB74]MDH6244338.1 hypothetical protein [Mycobacterium sp. OTB74]